MISFKLKNVQPRIEPGTSRTEIVAHIPRPPSRCAISLLSSLHVEVNLKESRHTMASDGKLWTDGRDI